MKTNKENYYPRLDILKIFFAAIVCLFHTRMHLGCDYGPLAGLASVGGAIMTGFFMLSGYSLFTGCGKWRLRTATQKASFIKKRILRLMPLYWVSALIYVAVEIISGAETLKDTLVRFPVFFLGIQSLFPSFINVSHNEGTWFVSCLLICYVVYPFLQEFVKKLSRKRVAVGICLLVFALVALTFVSARFEYDRMYYNPLFRLIEFAVGVSLARLNSEEGSAFEERVKRHLGSPLAYAGMLILFMGVLSYTALSELTEVFVKAVNPGCSPYYFYTSDIYLPYGIIGLPLYMLLLVMSDCRMIEGIRNSHPEASAGSGTHEKAPEGPSNAKRYNFIRHLAASAYAFYLAQLFSNRVALVVIDRFTIASNLLKIDLGLGICLVFTLILRGIEVLMGRIIITAVSPEFIVLDRESGKQ